MRKLFYTLLALSIVPALSSVQASDVKVKLINNSNFEIHEMYLSPTKTNEWGPDQLRDHVIAKNASFELQGIPVGKYDLKLVDEDGDECVVAAVKMAADEDVEINDALLVGCQAATAEADEGDDDDEEGEGE